MKKWFQFNKYILYATYKTNPLIGDGTRLGTVFALFIGLWLINGFLLFSIISGNSVVLLWCILIVGLSILIIMIHNLSYENNWRSVEEHFDAMDIPRSRLIFHVVLFYIGSLILFISLLEIKLQLQGRSLFVG
ncbi:hypothetical protein RCC89_19460 [Cytophagaceae bacterium ABcell3]|nr:hypothetical protein RCC89_19460 [Cytophagaceae bacterium ABcell3]